MLQLSRIIPVMIFTVVMQSVDGNQKIVHVSDNGNCSCNSLDHALANLTSNVLINITTDVTLSSLVGVPDLQNVSIIGHKNPTVNCKIAGGIHLTFCHNCIIEGITWDGCGADSHTKPGIKFSSSSNVTIQNCSFQHSAGQAMVLKDVSGDVTISNCKFTKNSHYRGHGAAIHYSSNSTSQFVFTINNCNFSYNKIKNLVYLESNLSIKHNKISFVNTMFCNNQGISVYAAINLRIYFNGKTLFQNNTAENGTGIYISDHSAVIFDNNSDVTFIHNSANNSGGAIFLINHSICLFDQNSIVMFTDNRASEGGAIHSRATCNVTFRETCEVTFYRNSATSYGAAIFTVDNSHFTFTGKANVTFNNNVVIISNFIIYHGGIIYSDYCNISFEGNSTTVFSNNTANFGGAILFDYYSNITFKGNSTAQFNGNTADYYGGAISSYSSAIIFKGNSTAQFNGNTADDNGGAIYSYSSAIIFKGNSTAQFNGNTAGFHSGAIYSIYYSAITFNGNSTAQFNGNTADNGGGAIYSDYSSTITFNGNSTAQFNGNIADYSGGAIYSYRYSAITFKGNSTAQFNGNTAYNFGGAIYSSSAITFKGNSTAQFNGNTAYNFGGAIYSSSAITFKGNSTAQFNGNTADHNGGGAIISDAITFNENSTAQFNGNTADNYGGAIYSNVITFNENSTAQFNGNTADYGGAIYLNIYNAITFKGNSTAQFNGNTADYNGGAIYSYRHCAITFKGNSTAQFNKNAADRGGGIYFDLYSYVSFGGNSDTKFINNIATYGGAISCHDNSYILFEGNSTAVFGSNNAVKYGGAVIVFDHSNITFDNNSIVTFNNNHATFGATVYSNSNSKVVIKDYSSVVFNDQSAKWCNEVCLPYYDGPENALSIDSNGIVWCNDQQAFKCLSYKCKCITFDINIVNISNKVVVLNRIMYGGDVTIIGYNSTVICGDGGGLVLNANIGSVYVRIEGITWIGCGAVRNIENGLDRAVLSIYDYRNVKIQNCSFQNSVGPAIILYNVQNVNIDDCKFVNSEHYRGQGTAISSLSPNVQFDVFAIKNCNFSSNKNAISIIHFEYSHKKHNIYLSDSSFHNNQGVSIYLSSYGNLCINGSMLFESNVAEHGAGIYIKNHSTVMFSENSNTTFNNNSVYYNGASVFISDHSNVLFDENSIVTFTDNKAINGTIYSQANSNVTFKATSQVRFNSNSATQYGAAIHSSDNSHVTFTGNATVNFTNNIIPSNSNMGLQLGGTIFSGNTSHISFEENSNVVFCNNIADYGAAIFSIHKAAVIFKDRSTVMFNNNTGHYCKVVTSSLLSGLIAMESTNAAFPSSYEFSAATIYALHKSEIKFSGHSSVTFINNTAGSGGALVISESNVITEEYTRVTFDNNIALCSCGGAFICSNNSNVIIKGNSNVTFNGNKATQSGGAIHSYNICNIMFKDNSTSTFSNNVARNNGGAILSNQYSKIIFEENSNVTFDYNIADNGGTFYVINSTFLFTGTSNVSFYNNQARRSFGVIYFSSNSKVVFEGNSIVTFDNNTAEQNAGALYIVNSKILFKEYSNVTLAYNKAILNCGALCLDSSDVSISESANVMFHHNRAFYGGAILVNNFSDIALAGSSVLILAKNEATQNGGAGYFNFTSNFKMKETAMVTLDNNKALHGGAICINNKSELLFEGNSTACFSSNLATEGGGAVKVSKDSSILLKNHTTIKFINNNAKYGGSIFLDTTAAMVNNSDKKCINFTDNFAEVLGSSVYIEATESCNSNCVINRTVGMNNKYIATPPNVLIFNDPAKCIDNDNNTQCARYFIQNIMLGTEIVIPARVLDYYNQSVDSTQFLVHSEIYPDYQNSGPKDVLISNNKFAGVNIINIGNQILCKSKNFSINITLYTAVHASWKQISVNLIIELSLCHPGFWQYPDSKRCECYNANDIVFCSGANSTIKRGYWFGSVTGKPTVTFCPINYCNFTCCEASNGYYHLSPVRESQCGQHRCGTACGNCEENYTLSFDSVECVDVSECNTGKTILVFALILLYWIAIIVAVFSLMHFEVGIGYLYVITYYYSVVDLLLNQNWYPSNALYTIINVISSFAKIIPQFLGQFCFITNMSGIDQQFIHYMHPVAISLFLVMITVLARRSRRLSSFISKGIIHVICCLLLLSYTSLATTSLLLMRPLIFHDVDKVYTYVSPDIEYCHGRHLVYVIVAVIFIIVIVIGLPLLLAVEPFLNSKINFIKIKPLLDQFQGCYKDKHRYFAAYYMICRLLIIAIIMVNLSDDFIFRFLLTAACVIMDLIHQILRPYSSSLLNIFDGVILHFLVLVSVLPLVVSFDSLNSSLFVGVTSILIILPLLMFFTMSLIINKEKIKSLPGYCHTKCLQLPFRKYDETPPNKSIELSNKDEYVNVIDDSRRVNATICEV